MNEHCRDALVAPAVARNRDLILAILRRMLPYQGTVLEIASGSSEHAFHFAAQLPALIGQPSDVDPLALKSIAAYRAGAALPNILAPLELNVQAPTWRITRADAVVCINMIHISPWSACEGLFRGAGRVLPPGGVLYIYGPFQEHGGHTAPSNEVFDASLRARNPEWGLRDLDEVRELALRNALQMIERIAMPANNLNVLFHRVTA